MIQDNELRRTLEDIEEYQSFCDRFDDAERVFVDGVRLAEKTKQLQSLLGGNPVSHAVQIRERVDQRPINRIIAPGLRDSYTDTRRGTDIDVVGSSTMGGYVRYVSDALREDFYPEEPRFVIPQYFYKDEDEYVETV